MFPPAKCNNAIFFKLIRKILQGEDLVIFYLKGKENERAIKNASKHEVGSGPSNYKKCIIKCTTNKAYNKEDNENNSPV
jgi:hypothetical protein